MTLRAPTPLPARRLRAFTLVEVLVVVIVLAILASVALPTLAGASAPIARPIADLLENDLRRARLEAMGSMRETVLAIGADRDSWWLQPTGGVGAGQGSGVGPAVAPVLGRDLALAASLRVFGSGTLEPYAGHRLAVAIDGVDLADGDAILARFDDEGTRDASTARIALVSPIDQREIGNWSLDSRRVRLREAE